MELKTVGLTKKFGSKIAVDDLNITLTMVSTACWAQMAQEKQRLCVCFAISKIPLPEKYC